MPLGAHVIALSVRQPFAWAILNGKPVENRSQPTSFRGRVLLHASKGCTRKEFGDGAEFIFDVSGLEVPELDELPRGAIVGAMDIVDCVTSHASGWFVGEYGYVLANVVALPEPIPCGGKLGFWRVPDDVAAQVKRAAEQIRSGK